VAVQARLDAVAPAIQLAVDALAACIQAGGGARVAVRRRPIGAVIEVAFDAIAADIEATLDAIASHVEAVVRPIAGIGGHGLGGDGGQQYGQAQRDAAVHGGCLVAVGGNGDACGTGNAPAARALTDARRGSAGFRCGYDAETPRRDPSAQRQSGSAWMNDGFVALYIFMLAAIAGHVIISRVPVILHTPLMSGSNFIHGIVLIGAMVVLGHADTTLEKVIGFIAVLLGAGNAAGGYVVTERMLEMFKSSKPQPGKEGK